MNNHMQLYNYTMLNKTVCNNKCKKSDNLQHLCHLLISKVVKINWGKIFEYKANESIVIYWLFKI